MFENYDPAPGRRHLSILSIHLSISAIHLSSIYLSLYLCLYIYLCLRTTILPQEDDIYLSYLSIYLSPRSIYLSIFILVSIYLSIFQNYDPAPGGRDRGHAGPPQGVPYEVHQAIPISSCFHPLTAVFNTYNSCFQYLCNSFITFKQLFLVPIHKQFLVTPNSCFSLFSTIKMIHICRHYL